MGHLIPISRVETLAATLAEDSRNGIVGGPGVRCWYPTADVLDCGGELFGRIVDRASLNRAASSHMPPEPEIASSQAMREVLSQQ